MPPFDLTVRQEHRTRSKLDLQVTVHIWKPQTFSWKRAFRVYATIILVQWSEWSIFFVVFVVVSLQMITIQLFTIFKNKILVYTHPNSFGIKNGGWSLPPLNSFTFDPSSHFEKQSFFFLLHKVLFGGLIMANFVSGFSLPSKFFQLNFLNFPFSFLPFRLEKLLTQWTGDFLEMTKQ